MMRTVERRNSGKLTLNKVEDQTTSSNKSLQGGCEVVVVGLWLSGGGGGCGVVVLVGWWW